MGIFGWKFSYFYDLVEKFMLGFLFDEKLVGMNEDDFVMVLIVVKGIGVWLVYMFMIFYLYKLDVFFVGDLGICKGF